MKSPLLTSVALAASILASCAPPPPAEAPKQAEPAAPTPVWSPTETALRQALAAPDRDPADAARDKYRHPLETLRFFGLQEDMTVVELWAGRGWYTDVLAPVLSEHGKLIATSYDPSGPAGEYPTKQANDFAQKLAKNPAKFGKVEVAVVRPPNAFRLGAAGSANLVLTFRNVHNWRKAGYADQVFAAAFEVLAPGGVLGVVEHRAVAGDHPSNTEASGYVTEEDTKKLAEKAGFAFVGSSEVNANPRDTKDYPEGVWTLPPALRLKEVDRAKYEAIGESDRMTLKFVKPK